MKRITTLLLASTFLFTGCTGDDGDDDGADTNATPTGDDGTPTGGDDGTPTGGDDGMDDGTPTGGDDGMDDGMDETMGGDGMDDGGGGNTCVPSCTADEDCLIMGAGELVCNADGICAGEGGETENACEANEDCLAGQFSFTPCTAGGGECDATMQVCVDLGDGTGGCATPPSEFVDCATLTMDEIMLNDIDGNPVTVCGNANLECLDIGGTNFCLEPCDAASCEATMNAGTSVCLDTGVCGCDSDAQCEEGGFGNTCAPEGFCFNGCEADADCDGVDNPYDGATFTCG